MYTEKRRRNIFERVSRNGRFKNLVFKVKLILNSLERSIFCPHDGADCPIVSPPTTAVPLKIY